jgi:hypothetical protein
MSTSTSLPRLAVLIDADNMPARYATAIFEEVSSLGEASIRRIYGDFSGGCPQGWKQDVLASLAIVAHQHFANTTGKNASDIALVIDAMDILHSGLVSGFVLVSSDSDFTRLASRIREQGLDVFGIGEEKTPAAFVNACKRFIRAENLSSPDSASSAEKSAQTNMETTKRAAPVKQESPKRLIERAMDKIEQESDWYALSQISNAIRATRPDFDPRNYGHAKFMTLVEHLNGFEIKRQGGTQVSVRKTSAKQK